MKRFKFLDSKKTGDASTKARVVELPHTSVFRQIDELDWKTYKLNKNHKKALKLLVRHKRMLTEELHLALGFEPDENIFNNLAVHGVMTRLRNLGLVEEDCYQSLVRNGVELDEEEEGIVWKDDLPRNLPEDVDYVGLCTYFLITLKPVGIDYETTEKERFRKPRSEW